MTPEQRFWSKVDMSGGPDACWPWTASTFKARGGYGKFQAGDSRATRRIVRAHRFAWELAHGPIPDGLFVCHECDHPLCCNPAHLFLGSPADNMWDKSRKGRHHAQNMATCKHGHEWTDENTRHYVNPTTGKRARFCRACKRNEGTRRDLPIPDRSG